MTNIAFQTRCDDLEISLAGGLSCLQIYLAALSILCPDFRVSFVAVFFTTKIVFSSNTDVLLFSLYSCLLFPARYVTRVIHLPRPRGREVIA